ncbi:MAG TPA: hypothetical protein VD790_06625 [Thermoleophilaceae bacterium]|nr:hypothetical protein [Thermoleophilaceae bacterium]
MRLKDWQLVIKVLPFVAATVAAKLATEALGWEGIDINSLFSGLVAATIFLLAFLLAGTLADYKESERLPGDLAASLESIADECEILYADKEAPAARECLAHVGDLVATVLAWLNHRTAVRDVFDHVDGLNAFFLRFEPLTQPNFIVRIKQEQAAIRRMVIRIQTIRETSFIGAGYAIAYTASASLIVGLLMTDIGSIGESLFFVAFISFLLTYVLALIRDLDDPFEFNNGRAGAVEVSLAALHEVERRIDAGLRDLDPETAGVSP